jgi:hypothetical protein
MAFNPGWAQSLQRRVKMLDVFILHNGAVDEAAEVSLLVLKWRTVTDISSNQPMSIAPLNQH